MKRSIATLLAGIAVLGAPMTTLADPASPQHGPLAPVADDIDDAWHPAATVMPLGAQDRIYGPSDAAVSVIVWADPECPYCKLFGPVPEQVVDASGGKVNYGLRLVPLSFHGQAAVLSSLTALCVARQAGSAAFFHFYDGYLRMTGSNGKGLGAGGDFAPMAALAAAAGAGKDDLLTQCVRDPATLQQLISESDSAQKAGVMGTPAIVVRNNRTGATVMTEGAIGTDDLQRAIDAVRDAPATAPADNSKT